MCEDRQAYVEFSVAVDDVRGSVNVCRQCAEDIMAAGDAGVDVRYIEEDIIIACSYCRSKVAKYLVDCALPEINPMFACEACAKYALSGESDRWKAVEIKRKTPPNETVCAECGYMLKTWEHERCDYCSDDLVDEEAVECQLCGSVVPGSSIKQVMYGGQELSACSMCTGGYEDATIYG
jgi:hypothetical protein